MTRSKSRQINRLPHSDDHIFSGRLIDRAREVRFELNDVPHIGFAGDTVLSAAMGNGLVGFGHSHDAPIALSPDFCPTVFWRGSHQGETRALPMDRTPIVEGGVYSTSSDPKQQGLFARSFRWAQRTFGKPATSLDLKALSTELRPGPWIESTRGKRVDADVAIVGAGVAGLSAALAAAERGERVILVEQTGALGGMAEFFGDSGDDRRVRDLLPALESKTLAHDGISIWKYTQAFAMEGRSLLVHRVAWADPNSSSAPDAEILQIHARKIVLAPGLRSQLPTFSGNRTVGISNAQTAFSLARDYGVWLGEKSTFFTGTNAGVNLALRASEAGVKVDRLVDTRVAPRSRFYDFSKAFGIAQIAGTKIAEARWDKNSLHINLAPSQNAGETVENWEACENVIVSGGFEPDLQLWAQAEGSVEWDSATQKFMAVREIDNVVLVGAAAGAGAFHDAVSSGENYNAVKAEAGETDGETEAHIEALRAERETYETRDDQPADAAINAEGEPAYLSLGNSLNMASDESGQKTRFLRNLFRASATEPVWINKQPSSFAITDLSCLVRRGQIDPQLASLMARTRCVRPLTIEADWSGLAPHQVAAKSVERESKPYPEFLAGRFSANQIVMSLSSNEQTGVEIGALLFETSSLGEIHHAIGIVSHMESGKFIAVVSDAPDFASRVFARVSGRAVECALSPLDADGPDHQR